MCDQRCLTTPKPGIWRAVTAEHGRKMWAYNTFKNLHGGGEKKRYVLINVLCIIEDAVQSLLLDCMLLLMSH